jgi:hypothetical protein
LLARELTPTESAIAGLFLPIIDLFRAIFHLFYAPEKNSVTLLN